MISSDFFLLLGTMGKTNNEDILMYQWFFINLNKMRSIIMCSLG